MSILRLSRKEVKTGLITTDGWVESVLHAGTWKVPKLLLWEYHYYKWDKWALPTNSFYTKWKHCTVKNEGFYFWFSYRKQIQALLGQFSQSEALLISSGVEPGTLDGVLLDAGCSSMQFDTPERGFSLQKDGPLDMRMDSDRYLLIKYLSLELNCVLSNTVYLISY